MAPEQMYDHLEIKDHDRVVACVLYSRRSFGDNVTMGEGRDDEDKNAVVIYGDLYLGEDGSYEMPFEVTVTDDGDEEFLLGETEFDLTRGRCFVVDGDYSVRQLPCDDFPSALKRLQ